MRVILHDVAKGHALPPTSLEFHSGAVRFAIAETEQRPTVLGLIASGRMRPASGTVTLDGSAKTGPMRRAIALVDAPDVSDPHPDVSLVGVVGEELMFAGRRATPLHARRWLKDLGYGDLASLAIGDVDPAARVRIMCELAVLRAGTEGIVLVSPDRHGGSPDGWWRIAAEFADRGYAMLVIVGGSAAVALERMRELGAINASGPIEPLVLDRTDADAEAEPSPAAENDAEAEVDVQSPDASEAYADPGMDADRGEKPLHDGLWTEDGEADEAGKADADADAGDTAQLRSEDGEADRDDARPSAPSSPAASSPSASDAAPSTDLENGADR